MARRSPNEELLTRALTETPPSDALSEQILDAAREQFMTHGVRRTTVDRIAVRARVSRLTVLRRIGGRDELLAACLLREYRRFVVDVDEVVSALPTREQRLVEGFVAVLEHVRAHPLVAGLLRTEPEAVMPLLTAEDAPAVQALRGYLADRLRHADPVRGGPETDTGPAAELAVRIIVSFLLNPAGCFATDDDEQLRLLARRCLVPLLAG
ncbi:TetR/AcrR family transcriptional regulator [Streptomyces fulvorobeus]|uniref:AcrR family transcriptional regulator n=1 Tax=Streptomyces fulvorobeus TaxID=284028 RepID=A0A7J0CDA5_9ACTN|nr:TetR/AcrR family transcriptional regulator [Streptomyces fulvorobeus]NYE44004.1 AcrR family transcriptional regulator [Streptomyces fulvorobeus]GFN00506.1 TetR family transcriptional regulator [Streptomyces fulvorobeus]